MPEGVCVKISFSMAAANVSALVGLGLQTVAAAWLAKLELRKGYIAAQRQRQIDALKYAIKDRERLIDEVLAQTRETNAILAKGAPEGTPDRYSLKDAVASYVKQIEELALKKEDFKEEVTEEFPALGLVGAIILIIVGGLLQIPLVMK